jgi:putative tricarboxylic transport membrane protein
MRRIAPIVLALLLTPLLAAAQEKFPSRPIDFVVTWGAGGGADAMARQLGSLSQPPTVFVTRPVSAAILGLALLLVLAPSLRRLRRGAA